MLNIANNFLFNKNIKYAKEFYERSWKMGKNNFSPEDIAAYCDLVYRDKDLNHIIDVCSSYRATEDTCSNNNQVVKKHLLNIYLRGKNGDFALRVSNSILKCEPKYWPARRVIMMNKKPIKK